MNGLTIKQIMYQSSYQLISEDIKVYNSEWFAPAGSDASCQTPEKDEEHHGVWTGL